MYKDNNFWRSSRIDLYTFESQQGVSCPISYVYLLRSVTRKALEGLHIDLKAQQNMEQQLSAGNVLDLV